MITDDRGARVEAALQGALDAGSAGAEMLAVAESIAASGGVDPDDLRRRGLGAAPPAALLVRAATVGLVLPEDRPRLRRDAYRLGSAAGADEGTAVTCVAAALVCADLQRHDARTTAVRVRQSLLEDAPMALLDRLTIAAADAPPEPADDAGAALQLALSSVEWSDDDAGAVLGAVDEVVRVLAAAFAGAASGVRVDGAHTVAAVREVAARLGAVSASA